MSHVPSHIAVIPDGNRRFATRLMMEPSRGHEWGAQKLKELYTWCKEAGIRAITVYSLSLENIHRRPKDELDFLFMVAKKELDDVINDKDNFVHKGRVKLRFFGRVDLLPDYLQKDIRNATEATKAYDDFRINFAVAYGGRQELVEAARSIGYAVASGDLRPEQIDEIVLKHNLSTNGDPDPDLIIRTGREKRISNFLLYQGAYSELFFSDSFWPDFTKEEFLRIIDDYSKRDRRFGK